MQISHRICRFIVAAILITVAQTVSAQSCQYEKNIIDALTEARIKVTQPITLAKMNNNPLYFKAQSVGMRYRFLKMKYYKYEDFTINEEREIAFRLSNNEEIVIKPRATAKESTGETMASQIVYPLSADQYEKLKRFPITSFKYYIASDPFEIPIKESKQTKIMEILGCID
ncbi:MAG: hypothetical protein IKZ99_06925 [Salinivirgaceae bacterium]|nr:hypothetical protein [Salinivirgaceae bacterium]